MKALAWLSWLFRIALFLLVLVFSLRNTQLVLLELVPGIVIESPLILLLLAALLLGMALAWLTLLPSWLRARRTAQQAALNDKNEAPGSTANAQPVSAPVALPDSENGI